MQRRSQLYMLEEDSCFQSSELLDFLHPVVHYTSSQASLGILQGMKPIGIPSHFMGLSTVPTYAQAHELIADCRTS